MGKGWRIVIIMVLMLLMAFAIMGSNNVALANPEKGSFMYGVKNADLYIEKILEAIMDYLKGL